MASLFQGQAPQQQQQHQQQQQQEQHQAQQVAAPAADGEVVCVDLSMRASTLQGFAAGDLRGRLRAASSLNSAVVKAVNKPALSSTDVLVGFYGNGRVQLSVTVPQGLESKEVLQLLGAASGALEGSVADADLRMSGQPYKKEADRSASTAVATTEAPSVDGEEKPAKTQVKAAKEEEIKAKDQAASGSQEPESGGRADKLVVLLCAVAGIGAAILIAALLPGGSGTEGGRPGLRPPALSTASALDGGSGVVRYAASDVDLTRPL